MMFVAFSPHPDGSRRWGLAWAAVSLTAIFVGQRPLQAEVPNILMIVSEDNGPELGCYGDPYAQTPNLDRLAAEGLRFQRAYVAQAGCSQSRASLLTGLYPHQHGQLGLATWGFHLYSPETPNIVRSLKAAGYRTGMIGKLHVNPESAFPFDFHELSTANFERKKLREYARQAEAFIQAGKEPFFLSVNYPDAHDPWLRQVQGLPPHPLSGQDVRALPYFGVETPELREMNADYYNCLSRLDSLVGDLLSVLERSGQAEKTLVIYLGDHGADFLRGKRTSYEGGVRIPLLARWPGKIQPRVSQELVSTVDWFPTLLEVCQAAPIETLAGRSLKPLFDQAPAGWREYLFTEYHTHAAEENFYPQRTVRDQRYKLIENLMPDQVNPGYDFTLRKLKVSPEVLTAASPEVQAAYRRMRQPPRWELYDLQADPFEFRNLAEDEQASAILAGLQRALKEWRGETGDPLLDERNLQQLKQEMVGLSKKTAKKYEWKYPHYFFAESTSSR
jgi:N-sulfoglucosamine sulfohydrolase